MLHSLRHLYAYGQFYPSSPQLLCLLVGFINNGRICIFLNTFSLHLSLSPSLLSTVYSLLPRALSVLNYYCLFKQCESHLLSINYKCFSGTNEHVVFRDSRPFHLVEIECWGSGTRLERKFRFGL